MKSTKILLADDHEMVIEGLQIILQQLDNIEVIGSVANGEELLRKLKFNPQPDIIILDINMPGKDGIELTKVIKEDHSEVKILIFTMYKRIEFVKALREAGADGYILKRAGQNHLISAINVLRHDGDYFSDKILRQQGFDNMELMNYASGELSDREKEVVQLIAKGKSSADIAGLLGVSVFTVNNHRKKILSKIGGKNSVDITNYGIKSGIVKAFDHL